MQDIETDVVIVGAGLAGAAAAAALREQGFGVTIREARERVGGRGYARGFAGGDDVLDFGGAWITPWHTHIRKLCKEHGVSLRPRSAFTERRWYRDGALYRDGPTSANDRDAHERAIARLAADAALLKLGHATDEKGRPLKDISFADYLDRIGAPPATRDLLSAWWTVSGNADKRKAPASEILHSSSYGEGLTDAMADVWTESLAGGVMELVRRMIAASGARLELAAPVKECTTMRDRVVIRFGNDGELAARAAIFATGLNPLRDIVFAPALPEAKREGVAAGHLGRAVKVWVKARNVPVGILATGGGRGIEWMFSERTALDGTTLLVGFGVADSDWQPVMPSDAEAATRRFFPEAEILAVDWHDWNSDPFSRGAWVAGIAGNSVAHDYATWQRHGPLAFASSDIAPEQAGWFEAAVISGQSAAEEIADYLQAATLSESSI